MLAAFEYAEKGDLNFFRDAPLDVILNARNGEDDTVLSVVVLENYVDCCEVICKRCPSLVFHQTSPHGYFALGHAAYRNRLEMMNLIIRAGINADLEHQQAISTQGVHKAVPRKTALTLRSHGGETAMHFALKGNNIESVKLLIEADPYGELLRIADILGDTPLHDAVGRCSNLEIAKQLIEADPDFPYNANSRGKTPLLIAITQAELDDKRDMLKLILELQPRQSKERVSNNGWTALHYAVSEGYLTSVENIIRSCPESSAVVDSEGQNFLHLVTKLGNAKMLKHILGMKEMATTVLNCQDNAGITPLDAAAITGEESTTLFLLEDPRVDKKLAEAKHLQWVVEKHNFVMMKLLIEANPDFLKKIDLEVLLISRDENGDTILFKAAQENHLFLCKEIFKRCPSLIYHQCKGGCTAMHNAALTGEAKMLKFLITAGAKSYNENDEEDIECGSGEKVPQKRLLTMVDELGDTALHKAVLNHKLEAVKLLIDADRDFEYTTNNSGDTPLMIAIRITQSNENTRDSGKIRKLLFKVLPNQTARTGDKEWTLLHHAAHNGDTSVIEDIIQSCPESSKVADLEGRNFFHRAVKLGNVEMVKHILGMKEITSTILNSQDNLGRTPWEIAAVSRSESVILCLHDDPRVNKKLTVTKNLNWLVEKHNFVMMNLFLKTNADLLMNIELEVFQNSVDEQGDTILFKAAQENHLFLCKELYKRCPSLIYHQSKGGRTAMHHAAWKGEPKMLKFLIEAGAKSYNEYAEDNIESGGGEKIPPKMLLTMVDDHGYTALHKAVLNHKLEAVKLLVEADPSYEYGANTSGDTPIMISIQEARSKENKLDTGNIRKFLFKMQPSQTMAHRGENGWTLLHQATSEDDLSIIEDIINFCPSCLVLVDNKSKNFLHIAAELGKVEVVRQVLRANYIPPNVLNNEDNNGNTPLHIAALTGNEPLTRCFLFDDRVIKTTVNKKGQHVLRAIKFSYDKRKAGVFGIKDTVDQSDLKDQRDFDLVVGALIATVSFTAGITVPGGYISEGPSKGTAVSSKEVSFAAFIISNTFALIFSLYAVFSHFCAKSMLEETDIIYQLKVATLCTFAAIYCMMAAFIAGSFAVLANSNWLAIVVCIISCLFFIFACRPMWKIAMQRKRAAPASQHKYST